MKNIFLDTNILVDYALGRELVEDAEQLLQQGRNGKVRLQASYLTFANLAYILKTKVDIYALFSDLCRYITVLPTDNNQLQSAMRQKVRDFEDMLQYQCAKANGCDIIITNNGKDYAGFCDLPFMTAAEFLKELTN